MLLTPDKIRTADLVHTIRCSVCDARIEDTSEIAVPQNLKWDLASELGSDGIHQCRYAVHLMTNPSCRHVIVWGCGLQPSRRAVTNLLPRDSHTLSLECYPEDVTDGTTQFKTSAERCVTRAGGPIAGRVESLTPILVANNLEPAATDSGRDICCKDTSNFGHWLVKAEAIPTGDDVVLAFIRLLLSRLRQLLPLNIPIFSRQTHSDLVHVAWNSRFLSWMSIFETSFAVRHLVTAINDPVQAYAI
mmetsp:Transcript_87298/g.151103  ORF Transcript_87298/g.151103 Transcript_87298/m.151103 type:complete len:246 (-) Transcript_87298:752-1489(-)